MKNMIFLLSLFLLSLMVVGCESSGSLEQKADEIAISEITSASPTLSATVDNDNLVKLSWSVLVTVGDASFKVFRNSSDNPSSATLIAELQGSKGVYRDTANDGERYYWVKVCSNEICSPFSNMALIEGIALLKIYHLEVRLLDREKVKLSWNDTSADYYEIYRNNVDDVSTAKLIDSIQASAGTSYQEIALTGTSYYWIKACRENRCSENSDAVSIQVTSQRAPRLSASINDDKVVLSWSDSSADYYEIYRGISRDLSSIQKVASLPRSEENIYQEVALIGTSYYRMKACDSNGCSDFSNEVPIQASIPQHIATLTTKISGMDVTLSWSNSDTAVKYYEIYRGTDAESSLSQKVSSQQIALGNSYQETAILGTHYYWVKSCNSFGCSAFSNLASTQVSVPLTTETLSVSISGTNAILSWDYDKSTDYYEVYRSVISNSASAQKVASLQVSDGTGYQEAAILGTRYYWIKACNSFGCSDFSNLATTQASVPQVATLSASVSGANAILSWDADTFVDYYEIYRSIETDPLSAQKVASPQASTGTSYQEVAILGTRYYWVKACNLFGCSAFSNLALTRASVPQAAILSASVREDNTVIGWSADTSVDYYEIYRNTQADLSSAQKIASVSASTATSYKEIAIFGYTLLLG